MQTFPNSDHATAWLSLYCQHCKWFSVNRLCLNPANTRLICLGSKRQVEKVDILDVPITATAVRMVDSARDLGVIVDTHLTWWHVSAVCRAAYYQLRQLHPLICSLTSDSTMWLVQAIISTRLDYCNSLLNGISDNLYRRLQAVQNAAAHLITNTRRCKHVKPILQQLHWLPVRQRVQFKIAVLVYRDCTTSFLCIWRKIAKLCLSLDVGHQHMPSTANQHTPWRSLIRCCWTSRMEQSANPAVRVWHYTWTISASTQNASIWSLTAAAPSDLFFVHCVQICLLAYFWELGGTKLPPKIARENVLNFNPRSMPTSKVYQRLCTRLTLKPQLR